MPEGPKEAFVANESKNRYRDILLLDNTRVILRNRECDYIHASRVTIGRNVFICTQGPLCNTAESFWAMVIQEKVKYGLYLMFILLHIQKRDDELDWREVRRESAIYVQNRINTVLSEGLIVMLCKFIEEGKEKCCEYFPKREGSLEIGKFLIECKSREVIPETDGVTCGKLEVTYMGKKTKVLGRSGCFVAVELALHEAATKSVFRMDTVLKDLRDQRMHCVQSDMQYLFVHRGLVEFLITRGVTKRMDVLKFITDYDNLIKRKRGKADSADGKENRAPPKKAEYTPSVYCNDTYY
ncbi:Protein-tyrosine phosphatase [Dictyocaulus viviparus]|uniref:Protein-tyrosine phosphatase n=1 Tax=Dictyocaulus viviparus TaxID=29172 RepID=A0A0D8Y5T1_DICVI|nr:Protein-tyrosine phosphatase [Dictyocaulus viviparus]